MIANEFSVNTLKKVGGALLGLSAVLFVAKLTKPKIDNTVEEKEVIDVFPNGADSE